MRSNSIYRFVLFAFLLLCMGCQEHISKEVTPSLNPRHLSVNKVKIAAPSASAYSAKLSVSSINIPWRFNSYPSWLSLTPNQGKTATDVSSNFTENPSANISRYAIFFLEDNVEDWDYKQAITASQPSAIPYLQLSTNRIEVSGATCQCDVNVYTNASWRVNEYGS